MSGRSAPLYVAGPPYPRPRPALRRSADPLAKNAGCGNPRHGGNRRGCCIFPSVFSGFGAGRQEMAHRVARMPLRDHSTTACDVASQCLVKRGHGFGQVLKGDHLFQHPDHRRLQGQQSAARTGSRMPPPYKRLPEFCVAVRSGPTVQSSIAPQPAWRNWPEKPQYLQNDPTGFWETWCPGAATPKYLIASYS